MPGVTNDQVRLMINDNLDANFLLDTEQFSDERIDFAREMTLSRYNMMTPLTDIQDDIAFPSMTLYLIGILGELYSGEAALSARNTLNYSDGGISIPLEERYQFFSDLAARFKADFNAAAQNIKIQKNMEDGWGYIPSDYARFPNW